VGDSALKAEEIEGLRELISQVILEERDKLVPVTLLQDVEELRRSPAGAVIRMEGKIDHLDEGLADLRGRFDALIERVATKEDMARLSDQMDTLEERMAIDMAHLSDRIDTLEERMVTKEIMEARFSGMEDRFAAFERRLNAYDFWIKLFGGVLTALIIAQLIAAFVK